MSDKLTSNEFLQQTFAHKHIAAINEYRMRYYGDLREKEAVKPFLDGLLKLNNLLNKDQKNISNEAKILLNELIQKGV